jgi:hypothetical protein
MTMAKINFNGKIQWQWQKLISIANINFNSKNQWQNSIAMQKLISTAKINGKIQ